MKTAVQEVELEEEWLKEGKSWPDREGLEGEGLDRGRLEGEGRDRGGLEREWRDKEGLEEGHDRKVLERDRHDRDRGRAGGIQKGMSGEGWREKGVTREEL